MLILTTIFFILGVALGVLNAGALVLLGVLLIYERTGIEWRLTLIHRPAYWSTVSREWPVKVGLGPR